MSSLILSQCRDLRMGVIREDLGALIPLSLYFTDFIGYQTQSNLYVLRSRCLQCGLWKTDQRS